MGTTTTYTTTTTTTTTTTWYKPRRYHRPKPHENINPNEMPEGLSPFNKYLVPKPITSTTYVYQPYQQTFPKYTKYYPEYTTKYPEYSKPEYSPPATEYSPPEEKEYSGYRRR